MNDLLTPTKALVPASPCAIGSPSRRSLLALVAAAPVMIASGVLLRKAHPDAEALVRHKGWVLRADDLARLGIA